MAYKLIQSKKRKEPSLFEEDKQQLESDFEKKEDLFSMKTDENEKIKEMNDDLYAEQSPIQIKDNETLLVKSQGKEHKITRKDVSEYQRKYGLEGYDGHDITGFRSFGTIHGNYEKLDKIYDDVNAVFGRLDDNTGSYKTTSSYDD